MGFFDRVGSFFDSVKDSDPADIAFSSIGAAWSAGQDSTSGFAKGLAGFDKNLGKYSGADAVSGAVAGLGGDISKALSTAYSYGVARPLSTAFQIDTTGDYLNADAWNQAWNRSQDISPGQAIATDAERAGMQFPGQRGGQAFAISDDPFSSANAGARKHFFENTWGGKVASGATDLLLNFYADPSVIGGKALKTVELARTTVKDSERATLLSAGADTDPQRLKVFGNKQDKTAKLVDTIIAKPMHEIPAMPELKSSSDAGALAYLFQSAKDRNAGDPAAMRQAVTDILGTAWGDQRSIDRLTAQQQALADEMERLTNAPAPTAAAGKFTFDDNGQGALELYDTKAQRAMDSQMVKLQAEKDRLGDVISSRASLAVNRVGSTLPEKLTEARALTNMNESWVNSGLGSAPIRMLTGATNTRIPGQVNIKDASVGYTDMTNVLALMRYTPAADKQKLMNAWVKAGTQNDRLNVVKLMNRRMVMDTGKKYNLDPAAAKKLIDAGEGRMASIQSALQSRLYSSADDSSIVSLGDPDEDIIHAFDKPLLQSQLEDMHPVLDPRDVDKAMKVGTKGRVLDHFGETGSAVADTVGGVRDLAEEAAMIFTKRWKDAALIRGAYPLRIQTDSQLRQMVHMETMQFMATRYTSTKGGVKYLLSSKDNDKLGFRNLFKEGDYEQALYDTLSRDVGDKRFNLNEDDLRTTARIIAASGGGPADISNEITNTLLRKARGSGQWGSIDPTHKDWLSAYQRVINQQIGNSPTAMAALADDDIPRLMAQVRKGGPLNKEWREVGQNYGDMETWLKAIIDTNNHYLADPAIRAQLIGKDGKRGYFNEQQLRSIFNGKTGQAKRMPVHGEMFDVAKQGEIQARYNKTREGLFKFMADAPETILARAPLFMDSYRRNVAQMVGRLGEDLTANDVEVIRRNAMKNARREMGEVLYDAAHASNMAHTMRYLSPFFTAWEDTMTKWTKLIYDQPQLLPRINALTQAPNDAGLIVDSEGNKVDAQGHVFDSNGERITDPNYQGRDQYVLLPKKLTSWIPRVGEGQIKVRKDSINSVFQGQPYWLPGFGPMVQVPVNKIVRDSFPKEADDPIMQYVLPYGTTTDSAVTQLLPKWVKTARNAFGTSQDFANQNAIFLAEATIDARDGGPPVDLDKIKNKTRQYFILKAVMDFNSPVSIAPDPKYQLYIDKAHAYQADPNRTDWQADFLKDFPGFFEMSMSLSANNTGVVATNAAQDGSVKYRKDIQLHPELGWMFLGPANAPGPFSGGVYDWQLTNSAGKGLNFRGKKDPQVALEQTQAEKGWIQWNAFNTAVHLELDKRGLHSTRQKGAEDLQYAVGAYKEALGTQNPAWSTAQQKISSGGAGELIKSATDFMAKHPEVRNRPDMVALSQYIKIRQAVKDVLATRSNTSLDYNPDMQYVLDVVTAQLNANNVGFEAMFNRALQFDNLQDIKATEAQA